MRAAVAINSFEMLGWMTTSSNSIGALWINLFSGSRFGARRHGM